MSQFRETVSLIKLPYLLGCCAAGHYRDAEPRPDGSSDRVITGTQIDDLAWPAEVVERLQHSMAIDTGRWSHDQWQRAALVIGVIKAGDPD